MTVLVVGSRPNSLGSAVRDVLQEKGYRVATAGVSGEMFAMDINDQADIKHVMHAVRPAQIVCTAGINESYSLRAEGLWAGMGFMANVNYIGPIVLLQEWLSMLDHEMDITSNMASKQFVAISSNSAHIARRQSIAYCASKAALSMAIRCAAREIAGEGRLVYGYEPGLLSGTPMTAASAAQFTGSLHRMPGIAEDGLSPRAMAGLIVNNLHNPSLALHGTMLRLDAGEQ